MGRLHELKVLKRDKPGVWKNVREEISNRLNKNNEGRYDRQGEIAMMKARKKKMRR